MALGSIRSEKPLIRPIQADSHSNPTAAFGTIAKIGSLVLVNIDTAVDSATGEMDSYEASAGGGGVSTPWWFIREIEVFTSHLGSLPDSLPSSSEQIATPV